MASVGRLKLSSARANRLTAWLRDDHFGQLVWRKSIGSIHLWRRHARKIIHFRSQWTWTFELLTSNLLPQLLWPALCFDQIRSFYGFSVSRKSAAWDGRTDGRMRTEGSPRKEHIINAGQLAMTVFRKAPRSENANSDYDVNESQ